ncbi:MAG: DivIVA domain-containing protein [Marmoricola sp.]
MVDSADVIGQIERIRFTPVRLREGYDMGDVDAFLDRLAQAARDGQAFAPIVEQARFERVRLREGYDIGEVDDFVARMSAVVPVAGEREAREAAASPRVKALVDLIRGARFETTMMRPGYPVAEVDQLLDELVEAALSDESLQPLLGSASFTAKRGRQGYAPADVDRFLRDLPTG